MTARAAFAFLLATLTLGVLMRVDLVTGVISAQGWLFPNLRHAHSHAGFYGVLTLCWWLVAARHGQHIPPRSVALYVVAAGLACVGFALMGYRPATIVLSTVVAAVWLYVGLRRRQESGWLDATPFGLLMAVVLIPPVAVMAKRDFALSRDLAHALIAVLLFGVFVPASLAAHKARRPLPALAWAGIVIAGAAGLIFPERLGPDLALLTLPLGVALLMSTSTSTLPLVVKALWAPASLSIALSAFVPLLRSEPWRIAGLHFLVLGPVLLAFALALWPRRPHPLVVGLHITAVSTMCALIVAPTSAPSLSSPWALALVSAVSAFVVIVAATAGRRL